MHYILYIHRSLSLNLLDGTKWLLWISLGQLNRSLKLEQILLNGLSNRKQKCVHILQEFNIYFNISLISITFIFFLLFLGGFGRFIYAATTIDVSCRSASTYDGVERRFGRNGSVGVGREKICSPARGGIRTFLQCRLLCFLMSVLDGM